MTELRDLVMLAEQRQAIVNKIDEIAIAILADPEADPEGAALVAACFQRAAEVARWTPYEPPAT